MSHPIDHVFCNPVENSFCGHPHTPRKFLPSSPPIPSGFPLTILVGGGGGGVGGLWIILQKHTMFIYRRSTFLFPLIAISSPFPQTESLLPYLLPLRT